MREIILDTVFDSIKLIPFLFITFLLMEYLEHKYSDKNKNAIKKSKKFGPIIGSLVGAFPQCGFGVAATNLYATRIITLGTLISVYLSTSDEMLPVFLTGGASINLIISVILIKIIIGIICGFVIDFVLRKRTQDDCIIEDFCNEEHCDCEHGIFKSSIKHTLNITIFIFIISFILNIGMSYLGEEQVENIFMKNSIFGPFLSSLIGLIPNCGASVVIAELYLKDAITFGSLIGGLLTGAGVGLLILFKVNKNLKQNLSVILILYLIGVIFGVIINVLGVNI